MNRSVLIILLMAFCLTACRLKHWMTVKVCERPLYVEVFKVNPAGEYSNYLTDSTTFRMYVGMVDPEEDTYTYTCKGDSITISKYDLPRQNLDQPKLLSKEVFSLQELKDANPIH